MARKELPTEGVPPVMPSEQMATEEEKEEDGLEDSNVVQWDGPDDPANPKNFSFRHKWALTTIVSLYSLISPLASSMVAPGVPAMSAELGVTTSLKQNMMVSIYLAGYVVGPLVLAPLSELYGRRPILMCSNVIFFGFNVGCSRASSFGEMVAFRLLAGLGGAGPISVGGGVLGDLWKAEERGKAVMLYSIAPLLGPCIGPIAGGFISESISWRWIFYITSIVAAFPMVLGFILLEETYPAVLLRQKTEALQEKTGNTAIRSIYQKDESTLKFVERSLIRPFRLLFTQPIIMVLASYSAVLGGTYYILLVTFTRTFEQVYHESTGIASLNYLALALGFIVGRQGTSRAMDICYQKFKDRTGGEVPPESRLIMLVGPCVLIPSGMLIYGWSLQYAVFWLVPDIGAFIFGAGVLGVTFAIQSYLIDAYPLYAASAIAATVSLRSVASFAFPLFAGDMYDALGFGWGNSLLALVAFIVGGPGSLLLYVYGPRLRARSPYAAGDKA